MCRNSSSIFSNELRIASPLSSQKKFELRFNDSTLNCYTALAERRNFHTLFCVSSGTGVSSTDSIETNW